MASPAGPPLEFGPMLAAYRLQISRKAKQLGQDRGATWGRQTSISMEKEERVLGGDGDYRLAPSPFPGLRSFDTEEGKLFFGREHSVSEVQSRLASSGIVVVLGGSGSGKSSLVRAGLLPYLNSKRRIPGRGGSWYKAEFRPRTDPLRELADALTDQVMLPLLDIDAPGLAKAMGLDESDRGEIAREKLREAMRARFDKARSSGREAVKQTLLDFVDRELDEYDNLASEGVRVPGASLVLLLDQFEEAFRPEIADEQRQALLDLVVDLGNCLERRSDRHEGAYKGGLFLVVTMRSEELHRCAEHRGLSEVVNSSLYLVELLDPENKEDFEDLHKAIVQPVRNVFDDWGLEYDQNEPDAPFEKDMPAWLLSGAGRRLPHRPDQLPLLQHALQATWHGAMRRWSEPGCNEAQLVIRRRDLPGQAAAPPDSPDLVNCLRVRADKAADRARQEFAARSGTSTEAGEIVLQAAFRSLARRDDRGNWARRFAEIEDIMTFLAADPNSAAGKASKDSVQAALNSFLLRGYLTGGGGAPYDISHEALIRNWPRFEEWLREPEAAARALERVAHEIDPRLPEAERRHQLLEWVPSSASDHLAAVFGPKPTLPKTWALQNLEAMLERSALKEQWQGIAPGASDDELAQAVLNEIGAVRSQADEERRHAEGEKYRQRFWRLGIAGAAFGAIALGLTIWDNLQSTTIALNAANAQSLLAQAGSDRGGFMPPDLRARVALRAVNYIDEASHLAEYRFLERPANIVEMALGIFSNGEPLPRLDTANSLDVAGTLFDITMRESFGRNFSLIGEKSGTLSAVPENVRPKCALIKATRGPQDWTYVDSDPTNPLVKAFRVESPEKGFKLSFGAGASRKDVQNAYSDLQIALSDGAWLCLSSDARVLTLSSVGNNVPDLYELQWAPCGSECGGRPWRVRSIPIPIPVSGDLKSRFPCIISINHLDLDKEETADPKSLGRLQVEFTAEKAPPSQGCAESEKKYIAEFFTGLAAPRSVNIDERELTWTRCAQATPDQPTTICAIRADKPMADKTVEDLDVADATIEITIRKRPAEDNPGPPILDVSVRNRNVRSQVSLPGNQIVGAAITKDGRLFLRDDAGMTWTFIVGRPELEHRLRKRGCSNFSAPTPESDAEEEAMTREIFYLGKMAKLYVDRACIAMR